MDGVRTGLFRPLRQLHGIVQPDPAFEKIIAVHPENNGQIRNGLFNLPDNFK